MSEKQNARKDLGAVTAYAIAVENGYVGTEEEFGEYLATAGIKAAQTVVKAAVAEGYAVGQHDGTDVSSGSPYYENNAKYYSEYAREQAELAEDSANASGYMDFIVDQNGHLIYRHTRNMNIDFRLDEGRLKVVWQ